MTKISTVTAMKGAILAIGLLALPSAANASMTVAETVNIRPEIAKSMCLEFKPRARLAECDASNAQKITLSRRDTPAAEQIMRQGNQCVEAGREGQALFLTPCRHVRNQTWSYTSQGQIKNGNGLCVDVKGGVKTANTPVIAYRCTGQMNQRWAKYDPAEAYADTREVKQATLHPSFAVSKCLDLTADNRLVIWSCHGGKNQKFAVNDGGQARILVDGRCLEAPKSGNGPIRGAKCDMHNKDQLWTVTRSGQIRSRNGGCVDVKESRSADGTEVLRWSCTNARNQKFLVR